MKEYGEVLENVDLKKYNTYGIGGKAKYLVNPFDSESLCKLLAYLKTINLKYFIIGSGSNIILPDEDYDGVIIKLDYLNSLVFKDDCCEVEAGIIVGKLVKDVLNKNFTNLAFLASLPGTLGGAIVGNAGCYGNEIFDYIKDVTIIQDGKVITLNKNEINYSYRNTEFKKKNVIILKATIFLEKGNAQEAERQILINRQKRMNSQPIEYKNAGSVFKNLDGVAAGKLIEDLGLKGKTLGGAKVSEKHANFIINFNNATSSDIIALIDLIKNSVKKTYNIDLELEQKIINW